MRAERAGDPAQELKPERKFGGLPRFPRAMLRACRAYRRLPCSHDSSPGHYVS